MESLKKNLKDFSKSLQSRLHRNKPVKPSLANGLNYRPPIPPRPLPPLPVEIWLEIATLLPKSDLMSLSTCSRAFRDTMLSPIFQNFSSTTAGAFHDLNSALKVLDKQTQIFSVVRNLELSSQISPLKQCRLTYQECVSHARLVYDFLETRLSLFDKLEHLTLSELELTQNVLDGILRHPTLTQLSLRQMIGLRRLSVPPEPVICRITSLEVFRFASLSPEMMSFLARNLVELIVTYGAGLYSPYLTFHYPKLRRFAVRHASSYPDADPLFQKFLEAHPAVTIASIFVSSGWDLLDTILPRLQELGCNWESLSKIESRTQRLKKLTLRTNISFRQLDHSNLQFSHGTAPERLHLICWGSEFKLLFTLPTVYVNGVKHITIHSRRSSGLESFESSLRFESLESLILALDKPSLSDDVLKAWLESQLSPSCPVLSRFELEMLVDGAEGDLLYTCCTRVFYKVGDQWVVE